MPLIVKVDPNHGKRTMRKGKEVVRLSELSKYVSRRCGVPTYITKKCIRALPEVIKELVVSGFAVSLESLGVFMLREITVPAYSYREKKGLGRKRSMSFCFERTKNLAKEINERLLGEDREIKHESVEEE